jgi:hypothetical protein
MLQFQSITIDDKHSRFGPVSLEIVGQTIRGWQNGVVVLEKLSAFPLIDIQHIASEFYYKDKVRVYCNKTVKAMVPERRRFFAIENDGKSIWFHNNKNLHIDGNVIRSTRSMELSFYRGNDHIKKQQSRRLFLSFFSEVKDDEYDVMMFNVTKTDKIKWSDRNKHFGEPVITFS